MRRPIAFALAAALISALPFPPASAATSKKGAEIDAGQPKAGVRHGAPDRGPADLEGLDLAPLDGEAADRAPGADPRFREAELRDAVQRGARASSEPLGNALAKEDAPAFLLPGTTRRERDAAIRTHPLSTDPAAGDSRRLLERVRTSIDETDAAALSVLDLSRRIRATYGETGASDDATPPEVSPRPRSDVAAAPIALERASTEAPDRSRLYRVWGIHEIQYVGPLATTSHLEFKVFAALFKVFGLYIMGIDVFHLPEIGAIGLSAGYVAFYWLKGPPFLFVQRVIDKIARIVLARSPALAWYQRLKGTPNRRVDLASIPGVRRVMETVRQQDRGRGWRSLWGIFPRETRISFQYIIEADRDITRDIEALNSSPHRALRVAARTAVRAVESLLAGLNPWIVVSVAAWGIQILIRHGIDFAPSFFAAILQLHALPFAQFFGPLALAIAVVWFAAKTIRDFKLFGAVDPHPWLQGPFAMRAEKIDAKDAVTVEFMKGPNSQGAVKFTDVEGLINGFLDAPTTASVRAKADGHWLLSFGWLLANWAGQAVIFAIVGNALLAAVLPWDPHWVEALWLVYFIGSMIEHKAHLAEIWRKTGLVKEIIRRSASDKRPMLSATLHANGRTVPMGSFAAGYGLREMLRNGFGQQFRLLVAPFSAWGLWLAIPAAVGAALFFGHFQPVAAIAFGAMSAATLFDRPRSRWTIFLSAAYAAFGLSLGLHQFEVESWKAAVMLAAGALTMISRQLALAGVSQQLASSRLPGAIAPAEGLPSPTFRYAGGMFSRAPKELLKDLIRSVFNVAAIVGAIKLAAWLLNPHPVLAVLSVKFGVWLMPLSLGGAFILLGGWLSALSHPTLAAVSVAINGPVLLVAAPLTVLFLFWLRIQTKRIRFSNRRDSNRQGFWWAVADLVF